MAPTSSSSLAGKVFVVTGAASGMGLATARTLLDRGASVGISDINGSALSQTIDSLPAEQKRRVLAQPVDVTDRSAIKSFLSKTKVTFGARLDGVANIAGTGGHKLGLEAVWETTPEEFEFIMDLNVKGLFNVLGESLRPGFLHEPASVVHISSMFSERGYLKGAVFSASKHAAVGMVKSAARELRGREIRVNAVLPGGVDTPMYRAVRESGATNPTGVPPMERPGTPQEIANVVAFLLSEESSYVTGASWAVDGGANA